MLTERHTTQDLAVQEEGTYALYYRIFDIFSKTKDKGSGSERIPIIASCFGGVFRVWSTKSFPGLSPSTELTKVCVYPSPSIRPQY